MRNIILMIVFLGCQSNSYNKMEVQNLGDKLEDNLKYISKVLNDDIQNYIYEVSLKKGFNLNSNKNNIIGLNIYDLNFGQKNKSNLKNNHIYHISPKNYDKSFSYILCVFKGKMYLFKSINCLKKGNTLEEVLEFINSEFSDKLSKSTMERLNNYRDYGEYIKIDAMTSLNCDYLNQTR